jgi:predicted ATP-grasp superfamily ATP-dependent carboligase
VTAGTSPVPAIVLGGRNALSVVRSLGRIGVPVYVLGGRDNIRVSASRFARTIPLPAGTASWEERVASWLLGPEARALNGAVLLACNDPGVETLARHREALLPLYRLDLCNPAAQLAMLDKVETYRVAREAGVDTPAVWMVEDEDDLERRRGELRFPLIVKPRSSADFQRRFPGGRKHLRASSFDEVRQAVRTMRAEGLPFMLVEFVPGPDDRGCTYCTYVDETGTPCFDFTIRGIRRSPPGEGESTYVVSERFPEVVAPALRLVRHVGLLGLACIEFKLDERDGRLKLIECNVRFVSPNPLLIASGLDLAPWIYRRAVGLPAGTLPEWKTGVRLLDPRRDFAAYRALARAGEITLPQWLRSLRPARTFWFRPYDPMPTVAHAWEVCASRVRSVFRRGRRRHLAGPAAAAPTDRPGEAPQQREPVRLGDPRA